MRTLRQSALENSCASCNPPWTHRPEPERFCSTVTPNNPIPSRRPLIVAPISVREYSVVIKLQVVTKEDRQHIAEMALAVVKDAVRHYAPDIRSGELVEIQLEEKPTEKKYD